MTDESYLYTINHDCCAENIKENKRNKGFMMDLALVAITMMAIGTIAVLSIEKLSES